MEISVVVGVAVEFMREKDAMARGQPFDHWLNPTPWNPIQGSAQGHAPAAVSRHFVDSRFTPIDDLVDQLNLSFDV